MKKVFRWRINFADKNLNASGFQELDNYNFEKVVFIACGTSYHAWLVWKYWFEDIADMETNVEISSEYEYKNSHIDDKTLYIFISQSWETADSIQILKNIKKKWGTTCGIVNVVWSSISRHTDFWFFTRAWTEVWVASTKAFTSQITVILLLVLYFGQRRRLTPIKFEQIINELAQIPEKIDLILNNLDTIKETAKSLAKYKNFFFLWRHYQLPIAYESSLKLKEISYLHSETYPAWELKHGPLALIDENMPSILLSPNDMLFDKNISTIEEIKARKWKVILVTDKDIDYKDIIKIPSTIDELYPFLTTIVWQLLAYYVALELGRDIDKPRNLAKSVTVK